MKEFLNDFMGTNKHLNQISRDEFSKVFIPTIKVIDEVFSSRAFRPERALNAAVFDSVMVGIARRLESGEIKNYKALESTYENLLKESEYISLVKTATSDETNVKSRLEEATNAFREVR